MMVMIVIVLIITIIIIIDQIAVEEMDKTGVHLMVNWNFILLFRLFNSDLNIGDRDGNRHPDDRIPGKYPPMGSGGYGGGGSAGGGGYRPDGKRKKMYKYVFLNMYTFSFRIWWSTWSSWQSISRSGKISWRWLWRRWIQLSSWIR